MSKRSTPAKRTCLVALVVVVVVVVVVIVVFVFVIVVVVVVVALPIEAACAVYVRNTPWVVYTASDLQIVCTATHILDSAKS